MGDIVNPSVKSGYMPPYARDASDDDSYILVSAHEPAASHPLPILAPELTVLQSLENSFANLNVNETAAAESIPAANEPVTQSPIFNLRDHVNRGQVNSNLRADVDDFMPYPGAMQSLNNNSFQRGAATNSSSGSRPSVMSSVATAVAQTQAYMPVGHRPGAAPVVVMRNGPAFTTDMKPLITHFVAMHNVPHAWIESESLKVDLVNVSTSAHSF